MTSETTLDEGEARELAGKSIGVIGMAILVGTVNRVVASLSSRDLRATCERVMADRGTPAELVLALGIDLQRRTIPIAMVRQLVRDLRNTQPALLLVRLVSTSDAHSQRCRSPN